MPKKSMPKKSSAMKPMKGTRVMSEKKMRANMKKMPKGKH